MNTVINQLIDRLAERVPELRLIDEDYGQLETPPHDQYPLFSPCVLIGAVECDWSDMGALPGKTQRGTARLVVRLAIDCYDDTHAGSGTTDRIAGRNSLNRRVIAAVQGFRPRGAVGPMTRSRSAAQTTPYNFKVYETEFSWPVMDDPAAVTRP